MIETLRNYIVTYASDIRSVPSNISPCVQMIYRINESGMLQRVPGYSAPMRSIMGITDDSGLQKCDPDRLCRDIISELSRRNYAGVVLDIKFGMADLDKTEKLCSSLSQRKITYFLPVELAQLSQDAKIIGPSSVSGGGITQLLNMVTEKYPPDRICLELVRSCNDFEMPAYKPDGNPLTKERLDELMSIYSAQGFFSSELGCKYFTYRDDGKVHFVLYDDAQTALFKIQTAQSARLYGVFLLYSEWYDSINQIFGRSKKEFA